ncbi:glycosyltransferase [Loigolactobacillus bifermentans]|uniref:glycosyltransferase n=1 Tax=Loigolactobacillus bifermentans TaxID=1607 RepID=UPI0012AA61CC|nr:glycosyltransferase [Loigolactobacillus bifermentans]QGG58969.1 glycosyltransferase [Loigolactobacillus bifermentans]
MWLLELRLGGRERVVGSIADSLLKENDVEIFSMWKNRPFFSTKTNVIWKSEDTTMPISIHSRDYKQLNHMIGAVKNNIIIPLAKKVFSYALLQRLRLFDLIRYIDRKKVDTIVLTDLTITFAPLIRKKCPSVRIIGWVHMEPIAFFEEQYKNYKKELIRGMNELNVLVTLTNKQAISFSKYTSSNVIFISNPMPNKSMYQSDLQKHIITVVCRIDIVHKGLDRLIEVAKGLPSDWEIHIAGSGSYENETKFKEMINENKLNDKVIWRTAIDGTELDKFYAEGSLFLMTSKFEGFPLTIGEAMSHGLPIIAFDIDGTRTILNEGKYGCLIENDNVSDMINRIKLLSESFEQRKKLSTLSLRRIKDFSISEIGNKWNDIL